MSFRIATAFVDVRADDNGLHEDLQAKVRAAAETAAAKVHVNADAEGLGAEVRAAADAAHGEAHVKVKVDEDGGELHSGLERLGDDAASDADRVGARIGDSLGNGLFRDANGVLRNASGQFASEAEKLAAGFETAGNKAKTAGNSASSAAGGFRLSAVGMGAAASAAIALIPALAAVPGVAAAAAAGIATLASAFFGVGKALHDYGAAQDAVGGAGGGGNTAATAYSNAVAIRDAEQAISDAREQAARSAQQSSEQVQNAQQGVVDAERSAATATQSAADQIVTAQQRVDQAAYSAQQAEQSYTNALYGEQQAQAALVNARQAAADQLVDSQLAASGAHLAVEQATANEKAAQDALTASSGNFLLTADQKAAVDLAARVATQQLAEAKQHEKEAVEKANAATAAGVDQAPTVLSAQHAVEMAAQSTASAQHGVAAAAQQQADAQTSLAKAVQAAANQQVTSSEQVARAQQSLADAQRQADQQREDSAKAVQRAEQNLTDTIKEQQLSAAAGASAGSAAVNKYAQDYAKLTPAAQAFVDQVLSMRGELHQLAADAQTATLPGFTEMLKQSEHLMPTVEDGIKRTGRALSDMALGFARLFSDRQFQASAQQFEQIITGGFAQFTSALPPLLNAIVTEGVRAAPLINAVAAGVHDIVGSGLPAFLSGLNVNASGAAVGVGALFQGVDNLLGPVGTLAGALGGAVGPALGDLIPAVTQFATEIEQALLPIMPQLSTDLKDAADVGVSLLQVVEPLVPVLADDLSSGLQIVDPLLRDLAGFLRDNKETLLPVAEGILAVSAATRTWSGISSAAKPVVDAVSKVIDKFGRDSEEAGKKAEKGAEKAGGWGTKIGNSIPIVGYAVTGLITLGDWLNKTVNAYDHVTTSADGFAAALLNSESASTNGMAGLDDFSQSMQRLGSVATNVTDPLAQTGLGLTEISQKLGFTSDELKNYDAALASMVQSGNGDRAAQVVQQIASATDAHGNAVVDVTKTLPQYTAAVQHAGVEQQQTARATSQNKDATDGLGKSLDTTKDKFQAMSNQMSQREALDRFHGQLLDLSRAADDNGTSLDGNSAAVYANKQAFSGLADQIEAYGKQLSDSGEPAGVVAARMQDMIGELETQAQKFGYSRDQVDAYIKKIGLIPSSVSTDVSWQLNIKVNQAALEAAANDIGHVVGHHLIPGQATGGPVVGPGSGTSDSVLRWLSNGEYVVPADAAAAIGPTGMEQIRNGRIPTVGGTTAQPAAPTIAINYYGTQQPTPEQKQIMMRDLALAVRG